MAVNTYNVKNVASLRNYEMQTASPLYNFSGSRTGSYAAKAFGNIYSLSGEGSESNPYYTDDEADIQPNSTTRSLPTKYAYPLYVPYLVNGKKAIVSNLADGPSSTLWDGLGWPVAALGCYIYRTAGSTPAYYFNFRSYIITQQYTGSPSSLEGLGKIYVRVNTLNSQGTVIRTYNKNFDFGVAIDDRTTYQNIPIDINYTYIIWAYTVVNGVTSRSTFAYLKFKINNIQGSNRMCFQILDNDTYPNIYAGKWFVPETTDDQGVLNVYESALPLFGTIE